MKQILPILLLAILPFCQLFGQSGCNCWESLFKKQGLEYEYVVTEMENGYIAKGFLKNSNPESYFALADDIISRNQYFLIGVDFNPLLLKEFENCFIINSCQEKLYKKIRRMNERLTSYKNVSPKATFKDFKRLFRKKDFESPFVRHYFLTFYLVSLVSPHISIAKIVNPESGRETSELILKRNVLTVIVNPNDLIYVNDSLTDFPELKKVILDHITNKSNFKNTPEVEEKTIEGLGTREVTKQAISFITYNSTSYDLYVRVQKEMIQAYMDARNSIAKKEFGISYEEMLNDKVKYENEIGIIRKMLPKRISETLPLDE